MESLIGFFPALWELTAAMAPYILLGLLFAGILHELVPGDFVRKYLGRDNAASVAKATLFGIPLPVCSCGVVPLAAALKKEGAGHGAVLAFLIATPITGIDSILATFGMFGGLFTLYRIVSSVVIAFAAGILTNLSGAGKETAPAFTATVKNSAAVPFAQSDAPRPGSECGSQLPKRFDPKGALRYGFVTLMGDIARPLMWGLLLGAAITAALPENVGETLAGHTWLGYLLAIAVAVPMYVCATASLPIAASLVLSGVSPGAAFVFLTAGPATNTVTIGVVKKMLGTRPLFIYLTTIVGGSILFGVVMDALFQNLAIDPRSIIRLEESAGPVAALASITLWGLIAWHAAAPLFRHQANGRGDSCCR